MHPVTKFLRGELEGDSLPCDNFMDHDGFNATQQEEDSWAFDTLLIASRLWMKENEIIIQIMNIFHWYCHPPNREFGYSTRVFGKSRFWDSARALLRFLYGIFWFIKDFLREFRDENFTVPEDGRVVKLWLLSVMLANLIDHLIRKRMVLRFFLKMKAICF